MPARGRHVPTGDRAHARCSARTHVPGRMPCPAKNWHVPGNLPTFPIPDPATRNPDNNDYVIRVTNVSFPRMMGMLARSFSGPQVLPRSFKFPGRPRGSLNRLTPRGAGLGEYCSQGPLDFGPRTDRSILDRLYPLNMSRCFARARSFLLLVHWFTRHLLRFVQAIIHVPNMSTFH